LKRALLFSTFIVGVCFASFSQQTNVTGRVELSGNPDASNVVVWLTPSGSATYGTPVQSRRQLLQKRKLFSPHLLVVPVGSSVEFPNQDPFFHNVFSLFDGRRFDLGLYEAGSTRNVVFNREGISYIFCNIHPEMSAVVVALRTPHYAVSDGKGTIVIPGVLPGNYVMHIWHERVLPESLNSLTRRILISETSNSLGVLQLKEQRNLSQSHKNKYGHDYDNPAPNTSIYTRP
jgi:plastocyanin